MQDYLLIGNSVLLILAALALAVLVLRGFWKK